MSTALARPFGLDKKGGVNVTATSVDLPPLGDPDNERRFWWQRWKGKGYDPENIATMPSVFDDPDTAEKYQPPANWFARPLPGPRPRIPHGRNCHLS